MKQTGPILRQLRGRQTASIRQRSRAGPRGEYARAAPTDSLMSRAGHDTAFPMIQIEMQNYYVTKHKGFKYVFLFSNWCLKVTVRRVLSKQTSAISRKNLTFYLKNYFWKFFLTLILWIPIRHFTDTVSLMFLCKQLWLKYFIHGFDRRPARSYTW